MIVWIVIGVCVGFFGGMVVGYLAFDPRFDKQQ
jgi:hypothetical protein